MGDPRIPAIPKIHEMITSTLIPGGDASAQALITRLKNEACRRDLSEYRLNWPSWRLKRQKGEEIS